VGGERGSGSGTTHMKACPLASIRTSSFHSCSIRETTCAHAVPIFNSLLSQSLVILPRNLSESQRYTKIDPKREIARRESAAASREFAKANLAGRDFRWSGRFSRRIGAISSFRKRSTKEMRTRTPRALLHRI